jgi:hypothetical protein
VPANFWDFSYTTDQKLPAITSYELDPESVTQGKTFDLIIHFDEPVSGITAANIEDGTQTGIPRREVLIV